jgi:hypothetical protein
VKYEFATAAARPSKFKKIIVCNELVTFQKFKELPSMNHIRSLKLPPISAEGLNTISAPFRPYIIQFWGWWRP